MNKVVMSVLTTSSLAVLVLVLLTAAPPPFAGSHDAHARAGGLDKGTDDTPECVHWRTQTRYSAYGYDHIVHIQNRCDAVAECLVWTNVHPDRIRVAVAADTDIDVLTYRGSPAREFTAHVECELDE